MKARRIRQGDIYWLDDCAPLRGDRAKRRPVVVVSATAAVETMPEVLAVACTSTAYPSDTTASVAEPGADAADEDVGGAGAAGGSDGLRGVLVGGDVAARAGGGERGTRGAVKAATPAGSRPLPGREHGRSGERGRRYLRRRESRSVPAIYLEPSSGNGGGFFF